MGLGNFFTQRTSSGYSAGIVAHASVNYLFNAGTSFGLAEASYQPDFKYNDLNNTLWNTRLRLWQWDLWGELKLGTNESRGARILLGFETMSVQYKRELWQFEQKEKFSWPQNRIMPRLGLGYELDIKKKWTVHPSAGMRFALTNKMGYDYIFNQFYAGVSVMYRVKSW
ncbi:MAG: hypothetical protein IT244_01070 [Bacteroidia bacterium]|nr:hypothetical protein [Bacteroidia bacterium]